MTIIDTLQASQTSIFGDPVGRRGSPNFSNQLVSENKVDARNPLREDGLICSYHRRPPAANSPIE